MRHRRRNFTEPALRHQPPPAIQGEFPVPGLSAPVNGRLSGPRRTGVRHALCQQVRSGSVAHDVHIAVRCANKEAAHSPIFVLAGGRSRSRVVALLDTPRRRRRPCWRRPGSQVRQRRGSGPEGWPQPAPMCIATQPRLNSSVLSPESGVKHSRLSQVFDIQVGDDLDYAHLCCSVSCSARIGIPSGRDGAANCRQAQREAAVTIGVRCRVKRGTV